jgi:hypothetical protein
MCERAFPICCGRQLVQHVPTYLRHCAFYARKVVSSQSDALVRLRRHFVTRKAPTRMRALCHTCRTHLTPAATAARANVPGSIRSECRSGAPWRHSRGEARQHKCATLRLDVTHRPFFVSESFPFRTLPRPPLESYSLGSKRFQILDLASPSRRTILI